MRHKKKKITLGRRDQDHTRSLVKNLLTSLFIYNKVRTTLPKAKVLRDTANKLLYRAINTKEKFNIIRFLNTMLLHEVASRKIVEELIPKYTGKTNYVRLIKDGNRKGDNAKMAIVELL